MSLGYEFLCTFYFFFFSDREKMKLLFDTIIVIHAYKCTFCVPVYTKIGSNLLQWSPFHFFLFQTGKWEDTMYKKKLSYYFIWHNYSCPTVTTKGYKNDRFTCQDHMYTFTAYPPILSHTV